jgi:hypothetical protein
MRVLTEISVAQGFEKLEGTHLRACTQTLELCLQAVLLNDGLHSLFRRIDTVFLGIVPHEANDFVSDSRVANI